MSTLVDLRPSSVISPPSPAFFPCPSRPLASTCPKLRSDIFLFCFYHVLHKLWFGQNVQHRVEKTPGNYVFFRTIYVPIDGRSFRAVRGVKIWLIGTILPRQTMDQSLPFPGTTTCLCWPKRSPPVCEVWWRWGNASGCKYPVKCSPAPEEHPSLMIVCIDRQICCNVVSGSVGELLLWLAITSHAAGSLWWLLYNIAVSLEGATIEHPCVNNSLSPDANSTLFVPFYTHINLF